MDAVAEHRKNEALIALKADSASHAKPLQLQFLKPRAGFLSRKTNNPITNPFVWMASYTVKPGKRDTVVEHLTTIAESILANEPKALSYWVLEDTTDENALILFERYTNRAALEEDHFNSDAFKRGIPVIKELLNERRVGAWENIGGHLYKDGCAGNY